MEDASIRFQSCIGVILILVVSWLFSESKKNVLISRVLKQLTAVFIFAVLLVTVPQVKEIFFYLNKIVQHLQLATEFGTSFVFGYLGGADLPFLENQVGTSFIFAFKALPIILVVSAISSILIYLGILQKVIRLVSLLLRKFAGLEGSVAIAAAANVFVGMIEAPLLIKPYLKTISRGGLFTLMTTGLSTIAGTVYVLYISILTPIIKDAILHLSIASFLSCLSGILVSSILVPVHKYDQGEYSNVNIRRQGSLMMAIFDGIATGLNVLMNVIATLIVFLALVYLINSLLSIIPVEENVTLSLQLVLGYILAPVMWACGIPWEEAITAGGLMGTKVVFNELMAFLSLAAVDEMLLSERSRIICLYALCGFANFGSLAILVGGLTTIVPERKTEILGLSLKALVAGCLATLLTASVVGVII